MNTAYATSADGWSWDWHGTVLEGRAGEWDARRTVYLDGRRSPRHDASSAMGFSMGRWEGETAETIGVPAEAQAA